MGSLEEWWGRTFERRGSIDIRHMPDSSAKTIRKLPTEDVLELVLSEDTRSVRGLLAHMEQRRREEWTARVALIVSIVALVVAAFR
jgi:hypothetical protein